MLLIDNFSSHKSVFVKDEAKKLNIDLCFLPAYSPQLQPIEKIWLDIKRIIKYHNISTIKGYYELNKELNGIILWTLVVDTSYKVTQSKNKMELCL